MTLRKKLLTGYGVFITALVVLGGWSAWRLQEMKESLERCTPQTLFGRSKRDVCSAIFYGMNAECHPCNDWF